MIKPLLLSIAVVVALIGSAQEVFPTIVGERADGKQLRIPVSNGRDFIVIGLAYGKAAQPLLEAWYEPAYLRFIAKHGLFAGTYSCDAFFVPVFVGVNKAAYEPSMRQFRQSAEPEIVDHVIFFKGEFDPIQQALGLKRSDIPYFFVLDAQGRILHRTEGAFSDDKLDAMEAVMME